MFNLGNDDKEKLKENMEQIKNMVEGQEKPASSAQKDDFEGFEPEDQQAPGFSDQPQDGSDFQEQTDNTQGFDDSASFDSQEDTFPPQETDQQGFDGSQGVPQEQNTQKQDSLPPQQPEPEQETASFDKEEESKIQDSRKQSSSDRSGSDLSSLNSQIPDVPESKDVDVPEIDKGPLFLRQQKFRKARELIEEMLYLSQDIQETVNTLEAGIQEDQRTEQDIHEMLKEFSDDRTEIENIISPKGDN